MTEPGQGPVDRPSPVREPIFLLPGSITALVGVLVAVHLASTIALNPQGLADFYVWFAYQPLRILLAQQDPSVLVPLLWTPFSHAFLHGGWDHLLINVAWLVIFATPVARRYGAGPMLAIFLLSAAAGALAFTLTSLYDGVFLIGASGGVAGLTGAAIRFIFQPLLVTRHPETGENIVLGRRLASIGEVFANPSSRFFTLIWLVLNAAVPLAPLLMGTSLGIAWQAHLGGFVAGFFLVALFERRARRQMA
jgi:membrane associated rhomboid family serine protease